jgi:hypothetical protein
MTLKKSDKWLLVSLLFISSLWAVLHFIQRTSPPASLSLSEEMLKPLEPQLDREVLAIIKKHRGL